MSIQWGAWDYGGGNGMRVGLDLAVSSVSYSSSSVTFTWYVYTENQYNYDDPQTITYGGSSAGPTKSYTNTQGGGGSGTLRDTVTYTYNYPSGSYGSSPGSTSLSATVGATYNGVSPSVSRSATIPARPVAAPAAPTGASLVKHAGNTSAFTFSWSNNPSAGAPYSELQWELQYNNGAWSAPANLSPSATSVTFTAPHNVNVQTVIRAVNDGGVSAWDASATVNSLQPPPAPSNAAPAFVSDSQFTITWTNNNTSTANPYANIQVDRWDNVTNGWYKLATVGVVTSYTDKTTRSDRRYDWRVSALNAAGASGYSYTGFIDSTPAAPSNAAAKKDSAGDIIVSWTNNATDGAGVVVWHAANGTWDASALATLSGQPTAYTHQSPDRSVTHTYRLQATAQTTHGPLLTSPYSAASNVVQLLAPPNAPTALAPNGTATDGSVDIPFTWQHNPVDTTDQTAFQVQHRLAGTTTWTQTGQVTSTVPEQVVATNLCLDPSGEYNGVVWVGTGAATRVNSGARTGQWCYTVTVDPTTYEYTQISVPAGTVTLSAWVKVPAGMTFQGRVSGAAPSTLGPMLTGTGDWQQVAVTADCTAGLANWFPVFGPTAQSVVTVDDLGAAVGGTPADFNGDTASDTTYSYRWTGTPGASTSEKYIPEHVGGGLTASTWTLPGGTYANGQSIEWQVQTWGAYTSPSPFSATATVALSTPPSATITPYPSDTDTITTAACTWTYFDAEGDVQSGWRTNLYASDKTTLLETQTGAGTQSSVTFTTTVQNGSQYWMQVQVQDGTGLWSNPDDQGAWYEFTVTYAPPPTPTLGVVFDPDMAAVQLTVTVDAPDTNQVPALTAQLLRQDGTRWVIVADNVDLSSDAATVTDYLPPLGGTVTYQAISVSSLPSTATSASENVDTPTGSVWINAGPGFGQSVQLRYNPNHSWTPARAKTLHQFAGRQQPVEYAGEQRTEAWTLQTVIPVNATDCSSPDDIAALADFPAPACYRDPAGRRIFVSTGAPQLSGIGTLQGSVSWSMTRIDWPDLYY